MSETNRQPATRINMARLPENVLKWMQTLPLSVLRENPILLPAIELFKNLQENVHGLIGRTRNPHVGEVNIPAKELKADTNPRLRASVNNEGTTLELLRYSIKEMKRDELVKLLTAFKNMSSNNAMSALELINLEHQIYGTMNESDIKYQISNYIFGEELSFSEKITVFLLAETSAKQVVFQMPVIRDRQVA